MIGRPWPDRPRRAAFAGRRSGARDRCLPLGLALVAIVALVSACSDGAAAFSPSAPRASSRAAPSPAQGGHTSASALSGSLTIYAAASLKAAISKADSTYQAAHPGLTITLSTDSSATLETQIEQGAPADLFLSADTRDPQKLIAKGLAAGPMTVFAGNRLTIIVPRADPAGITSPRDLVKPGVKIIAAGAEVPITRYATQLVANLAKQPGYPVDFAAKYRANVVSREDDVSAVVAKIGLAEGDAGICYVTDARTSTGVATVDLPDGANVPATYGGVIVKASARQAAARAFLTWLSGPDGQAVLASFGFLPPPS